MTTPIAASAKRVTEAGMQGSWVSEQLFDSQRSGLFDSLIVSIKLSRSSLYPSRSKKPLRTPMEPCLRIHFISPSQHFYRTAFRQSSVKLSDRPREPWRGDPTQNYDQQHIKA